MPFMTATYSPDDNKLRLYPVSRLDAETYARVRAAGFIWAPKQELFVAPTWTPDREDLLVELCGEIGDEDSSLVDRAEERADRFGEYSEKRAEEAEGARRAVSAIADNIPLGQPILVGHHSERHARKDAERIENGMRKSIELWKTAKYWESRARGAIANAKYKERPDVRARRIKKLEAEQRKTEKTIREAKGGIATWTKIADENSLHRKDGTPTTFAERAKWLANLDRAVGYGIWGDLDRGTMTPEEAQTKAIASHTATLGRCERWAEHYTNRLAYERAMLADAGGIVTDRTGPEKGGACKCWVERGSWLYIQKINKISVTVLDNWGNGGKDFTRTIPFDKLTAVMTAAQVQEARDTGMLVDLQAAPARGFILRNAPLPERKPADAPDPQAAKFSALGETLKARVQVVVAAQLFPTPTALAKRMVEIADIQPDDRVLEPSAGTGMLAKAVRKAVPTAHLDLIEIDPRLCSLLKAAGFEVTCFDFMAAAMPICPDSERGHDRIIMNPPFANGAGIAHIKHALTFLRPGGRLVAICADGPRQQAELRPLASTWEELPEGTFAEAGTRVSTVLLTIDR